jgi:hypothetical protein
MLSCLVCPHKAHWSLLANAMSECEKLLRVYFFTFVFFLFSLLATYDQAHMNRYSMILFLSNSTLWAHASVFVCEGKKYLSIIYFCYSPEKKSEMKIIIIKGKAFVSFFSWTQVLLAIPTENNFNSNNEKKIILPYSSQYVSLQHFRSSFMHRLV